MIIAGSKTNINMYAYNENYIYNKNYIISKFRILLPYLNRYWIIIKMVLYCQLQFYINLKYRL